MNTDEKEKKIEAVRGILKALDKSISKGGILLTRVRFKREEHGSCTDILIDYEQTGSGSETSNAREGSE